MSDQNENSPILTYATPGAREPRPPFFRGRWWGLISSLLAPSSIATAFIIPRFEPPLHLTFHCCCGMLFLGMIVGIFGIVLDGRKSAAFFATTMNLLLFIAAVWVYPISFWTQ